jgi:orotate phosphoribosyltransferase
VKPNGEGKEEMIMREDEEIPEEFLKQMTERHRQAVEKLAALKVRTTTLTEQEDRKRVLDLLRTHSFKRGKFTLSSGKESDFYLDCKKALTTTGLACIGSLFSGLIVKKFADIQGVGGMTMGADPLAVATCLCAGMFYDVEWQAFYVRKEPKKHGTEQWIEGPALDEGARVVIVEDVITTGASAIKAIQRARIHRLNPVLVLALVDRCEDDGRQNIEAEGLPVCPLFTRQDFIPDGA